MARICLSGVTVDFTIYNTKARSLKRALVQAATGGRIGTREDGRVVVRALDDINLEVRDGDRLGIIGGNGSGKTTLLRVMNRVYHPINGAVHIDGEVASLLNISLGSDPEATGRENIRFRAALLGLPAEEIMEKTDEIAEFTELAEYLDVPLRTYSSGMQIRLAFAISTVLTPEILLMDEWLSLGDAAFRSKAERRLREMVESTKMIVLATHSKEL